VALHEALDAIGRQTMQYWATFNACFSHLYLHSLSLLNYPITRILNQKLIENFNLSLKTILKRILSIQEFGFRLAKLLIDIFHHKILRTFKIKK
jgi:hypothetical protein